MARGSVDLGRGGAKWWCPYKKITIIVCCVNLIAVLFVVQWFYALAASSGSSARWISDVVEFRKTRKLKDVEEAIESKSSNSSIPHEEGKLLKQALEFSWPMLLEDIGLWMPADVVNTEHKDKPEDAIEQEEE